MDSKIDQVVTISGYVGTKHNYKKIDLHKSVISLTIKPKEGDWIYIKAFNRNADIIKDGIEQNDIKKLTVTGKWKDGKPYQNATGELVNYQELVADTVSRHKTIEVQGIIVKVDEKKTSNNKPYTHLFVKNNFVENGAEKIEQFNISIFPENKKNIPKDVELVVGKPVAVKGEATINTFLNKDNILKESISITAWNIDRTPSRLRQQITGFLNAASKKEDIKPQAQEPVKKVNKENKNKGLSI